MTYNIRQALKNIISSLVGIAAGNTLLSAKAFTAESVNPLPGITKAGLSNDFTIVNSGIGGNTTKDLLSRIDKDCYAHKPELTILMAGTNDMNSVKYIPLNQYEKNLRTIAKGILDSGSKLIMMTILPCYEPDLLTRHPAEFYQPEGISGRRTQVNTVVKKVAADYNAYLLDLEHRFLSVGKISDETGSLIKNLKNSNKRDGIHPTANGYRFIALTVYDFIVNKDIPYNRTVCFGDSITKGDAENYPAYLKALLSKS